MPNFGRSHDLSCNPVCKNSNFNTALMKNLSQSSEYISPRLKVVELKTRRAILQGSKGTQTYDGRTATDDWWLEED